VNNRGNLSTDGQAVIKTEFILLTCRLFHSSKIASMLNVYCYFAILQLIVHGSIAEKINKI